MEAPQLFGNLFDPRSETSPLDNEGLVLWKKLVHKVPWESAFEGIEVHECWSLFRSTGVGTVEVLEVKQVGQEASLAEQGPSRT